MKTLYRCIDTGGLARSINSLNPLGFKPLDYANLEYCQGVRVPFSEPERQVLHGAVLSEGTPEWVRTVWLTYRELWVPRDWCLEWVPETEAVAS